MVNNKELKETEIGYIPVEWEVKKQSEVSTFYNGRAYKQTEFTEKGTPVIRIQNLTGGSNYVYSDLQLPENKYVDSGDLIYAWSATFGPHLWKGLKSIYHYHIWKIKCDETVINKLFYYYRLHFISNETTSQKNGAVFAHLTKSFMENYKIALPPLAEQYKIADILTTVDNTISKTEAIIKQTEKVKKGLMQQLLTKGIGHTKFKQTEIGEIPEEWEVTSFKNLFSIRHGYAFKSEFFSEQGNYVLLTPGNFEPNGGLKLKGAKEKYYIGEYPEDYLLKSGDLLVVMTDLTQDCNILGSPAFVPNDNKFLHNQRLGKLININKQLITLDYVYLFFNSKKYRDHLKSTSTGTTVRHTSPSKVLEVSIPLPSIFEQMNIVKIVKSIENKLKVEKEKLSNLSNLKQGLMQFLLTGKVRVKVNEQQEVI